MLRSSGQVSIVDQNAATSSPATSSTEVATIAAITNASTGAARPAAMR